MAALRLTCSPNSSRRAGAARQCRDSVPRTCHHHSASRERRKSRGGCVACGPARRVCWRRPNPRRPRRHGGLPPGDEFVARHWYACTTHAHSSAEVGPRRLCEASGGHARHCFLWAALLRSSTQLTLPRRRFLCVIAHSHTTEFSGRRRSHWCGGVGALCVSIAQCARAVYFVSVEPLKSGQRLRYEVKLPLQVALCSDVGMCAAAARAVPFRLTFSVQCRRTCQSAARSSASKSCQSPPLSSRQARLPPPQRRGRLRGLLLRLLRPRRAGRTRAGEAVGAGRCGGLWGRPAKRRLRSRCRRRGGTRTRSPSLRWQRLPHDLEHPQSPEGRRHRRCRSARYPRQSTNSSSSSTNSSTAITGTSRPRVPTPARSCVPSRPPRRDP